MKKVYSVVKSTANEWEQDLSIISTHLTKESAIKALHQEWENDKGWIGEERLADAKNPNNDCYVYEESEIMLSVYENYDYDKWHLEIYIVENDFVEE